MTCIGSYIYLATFHDVCNDINGIHNDVPDSCTHLRTHRLIIGPDNSSILISDVSIQCSNISLFYNESQISDNDVYRLNISVTLLPNPVELQYFLYHFPTDL